MTNAGLASEGASKADDRCIRRPGRGSIADPQGRRDTRVGDCGPIGRHASSGRRIFFSTRARVFLRRIHRSPQSLEPGNQRCSRPCQFVFSNEGRSSGARLWATGSAGFGDRVPEEFTGCVRCSE